MFCTHVVCRARVGGSGADSTMELNEFTDLCNEMCIPDKNSKHCKLKDIDGIFIAAAFKSKEEAEMLGIGKKSLGAVLQVQTRVVRCCNLIRVNSACFQRF